jgi:hypothetical protein
VIVFVLTFSFRAWPPTLMLIEFTVKNYRSFRDEQSWMLTADPEFGESTVPMVDVPETDEDILPSAVLYGPNASGKTNLLRALKAMQDIVLYSANSSQRGDAIDEVEPFQFDPAAREAPTMFEAVFVQEGVRYQYGFEATRTAVTEEWLFAYPKGKAQTWFERTGNDADSASIEFGRQFGGQKSVIRQATRPNALFLSTAVQLNHEQLAPVYDWFNDRLRYINANKVLGWFTLEKLEEKENHASILRMMRKADLGITGFEIDDAPAETDQMLSALQKFVRAELGDSAKILGDETTRIKFRHKGEGSSRLIDFANESQGTQRYFALAGPLLDVLENGRVLVVDELDASLHPIMVRAIVQFFHDPSTNPNGAQLLFNTHDTTLLDADLFRRDQVWFTEKFDDGATRLYALLDFDEPDDARARNLARRYLQGRYGAVPILQFSSTTTPATNGAETKGADA